MEKEIELSFQSSNSESDKLLVCLHGNPTDSNYFSALLKGIDGWNVVAPDFIGHGESPRLEPSEYNYEVFIKCLVNFLKQFTYKKLVIMGHSMGGNLAIELMQVLKIDGLLLLEAPPVSPSSGLAPYLEVPDLVLSDNQEENPSIIEKYVSNFCTSQTTVDYLKNTLVNTDPIFRDRLLEEFEALKFSDQLETIKQSKSTYIGCVMALNDNLANNEYLIQLKSEGVFDFFAEIQNAGHYSLLDNPEDVYESIMNFIEKLHEERQ